MRGLIIGKIFSSADLAYYNRGEHFPFLIVNNINSSIQSVMLPSLTAIQDDKPQVKRMMRRAIVTSSFIIFPMMTGLAVMAKQIVLLLLGEKWLPCVPFLQVYCLVYAFYPIHTSNLSTINALGRSDIFLKLEIIKKVIGISILIGSIFIFYSPIGIAYGALIATFINAFVNASPNKKMLNYGYFEQIWDIIPSFCLALLMGISVFLIGFIKESIYITLILQIITGIIIYLGLAKILHFECLEYIIQTIKGLKHGK